MPEYVEIKITKDYINSLSNIVIFNKMAISTKAKNKINTDLPFKQFKITSTSRGKELKLVLRPTDVILPFIKIVFRFGMTGNWHFIEEKEFKKLKHVHLYFEGTKGGSLFYLAFQDVRRFGGWRLSNWGEERGPDPLDEHNEFVDNIKSNLNKKVFEGRILEVLMNQKYFNGIGNYLRAEILATADVNPFLSAREVLTGEGGDRFLQTLKTVLITAYNLGGAQLKDWRNPFGVDKIAFMNWLQAYSKGENILDKQNRKFWYLTKWKK